jgi:pimeloyl-ACP methyl ester carboxylesterase
VTRRALAAVVAVALLAAASCTSDDDDAGPAPTSAPASRPAPSDVDPALSTFYGQTLEWETCREDFECATLEVPLDYEAPDGDTIEVELLRSPATGDDRIGSLIVNPGGPGGSGLDYAASGSVITDDVHERFDVVGFDPRGVGESTPIDCLDDAALDEFVAADGSPDDAAEVVELEEQTTELAEGCQARSGELLPHVGTADVARDLDVLRATLGDDKLNYLGSSYGTYIGALYAEQFPQRVGRVVLDGAIDPSLTGDKVGLGQAEGFERALSSYLEFCIAEGDCSLGETDTEARSTLANLLAVIDESPLPTDDDERPLTQALAILGIVLPLYLTPDQGYEPLSQALESALAGDGAMLLRFADIYLFRNPDGTYDGNSNEVILAVNCLDKPDVGSVEEVEAGLPQFEAASQIFGSFLGWGGLACANWPVAPVAEPAPVSAAGADPILVVGTTGDPATPYEWAEALASQLSSGVLLTREGFGHLAYQSGSECIDDAIDAYLVEGTGPEDGLRCS